MGDHEYDVLIIGASLGGVAAGLRAAAMGASVCLIDSGDWVGGQFTAQGVCKPDENKYIDSVGSTKSYQRFRQLIRDWYHANTKLSATGKSQPLFNPGGPYKPEQPLIAVEPKVGDTILKSMISKASRLHWHPKTSVKGYEVAGNTIGAVVARGPDGSETRYVAKYVLDATDLGDVLPQVLPKDEWVIGAESGAEFGELGWWVPKVPRPDWIQPITWVFALEHRGTAGKPIRKPPNYEKYRDEVLPKGEHAYSVEDGNITTMFGGGDTMWNYRQYIDARNFDDPRYRYDRTTMNTGSNDYGVASIPTGDPAEDARIIAAAREKSMGYLYWIQTECPREDGSGKRGYPELQPSVEAFGTKDGFAPVPYIRESRRIKALETIKQEDVAKSGDKDPRARAELFKDSCGIGTYGMMDVHKLPGKGMPWSGVNIRPAQIRMGALIPRRMTNLLAACKNIGTTHLSSGLYRLHPFEWNIGESAGALAAFCLAQHTTPHAVAADQHLLRQYQRALLGQGVPLYWWTDVKPDDPLWSAVQMAGATKTITGSDTDLRFNPGGAVSDGDRAAIGAQIGAEVPAGITSRGHLAQWLFEQGHT